MRLSIRARWSSRVSRSRNVSTPLGFGALRQFVRPPRLARPALGAVAVAFGGQGPRQREAAPWRRWSARSPVKLRTVAGLLRSCRTPAPPPFGASAPGRANSGYRRQTPQSGRGALKSGWPKYHSASLRAAGSPNGSCDGGCVSSLCLARQVDRILFSLTMAVEARRRRAPLPEDTGTRRRFGWLPPHSLVCRADSLLSKAFL